MIKRFFRLQTKNITLAAVLLAASAFASRLLGLYRDRLLAGTFGAGEDLDVYFAAFRIPDFVYNILIMGGISAVFLPIFSEYWKKSEADGWRLANNVLNCFSILLVGICGVLAIFTPILMNFIAPGFEAHQKILAISLTRIMFLSPILFGISSLFSGVLHYFNRFFAYAVAPLIYNLGIIFGILFLAPAFGIKGVAFGVILGAFLYLAIQWPAMKISGFKYQAIFNFSSPGLKKILKLMIPRTVGTFAYNINLIIVTAIASTLGAGAIAIFNFANNIQYFPIGIVGASLATAIFPFLSKAWADNKKQEFLSNFSSGLRQILFIIIPLSFLLFLLRAQIVRLILGTGQFNWQDTRLTAASLGLFCLGILGSAAIPFLSRVFYAFQNTKTPVFISLISMALNIGLCFLFVWLLGFANPFQAFLIDSLKLSGVEGVRVIGLPLALSVSAIFQFCLLIIFLRRALGSIRLKEVSASFGKIITAAVLMAIITYLTLQISADFMGTTTFLGVLTQTALAGMMGIIAFLFFAHFFRSPELKKIKFLIFRC